MHGKDKLKFMWGPVINNCAIYLLFVGPHKMYKTAAVAMEEGINSPFREKRRRLPHRNLFGESRRPVGFL